MWPWKPGMIGKKPNDSIKNAVVIASMWCFFTIKEYNNKINMKFLDDESLFSISDVTHGGDKSTLWCFVIFGLLSITISGSTWIMSLLSSNILKPHTNSSFSSHHERNEIISFILRMRRDRRKRNVHFSSCVYGFFKWLSYLPIITLLALIFLRSFSHLIMWISIHDSHSNEKRRRDKFISYALKSIKLEEKFKIKTVKW